MYDIDAPIVIGGLGGSGTRLIAEMFACAGVDIGSDLNRSSDNLWFTLLLKRRALRAPGVESEVSAALQLLAKAMTSHEPLTTVERKVLRRAVRDQRGNYSRRWCDNRRKALLSREYFEAQNGGWGWKEPNSHIFLDRLMAEFPRLRYVHVMRHGLDMAYSRNQGQYARWHWYFDLPPSATASATPRDSLAYWCVANDRVRQLGHTLGDRFLMVNYDDLCLNPGEHVPALLDFVGARNNAQVVEKVSALAEVPPTVGRYKSHDISGFAPEDVAFVSEVGFRV